MGAAMGMQTSEAASLPPMGLEINRIKEYVRGTNARITDNSSMIKTTPPGTGSRFMNLSESNPVFDYFAGTVAGVRLMAVGPFSEDDLGIRCYHSKTGAVELVLNHLIDKKGEYVLVDMTAGADSFASGLFTRFDVTFLVVEPTLKSLSVYAQYKEYARNHNVTIKVIGNKVETEEDAAFIKTRVGDDLVAVFASSPFVKKSEKGEFLPLEQLEDKNKKALEQIIAAIDAQSKNWQKFYAQAVEFHVKNAKSWANADAGFDLSEQVDPEFDMARAVSV
jgi:CO dehydrogenase maturation factor